MSTPPDPVDELLGALKPLPPPTDVRPQAERAFRHHATESKKGTAAAWRIWGRWLEPVLVGAFVLIFVLWALRQVLGG
jgi:hypothetical protein